MENTLSSNIRKLPRINPLMTLFGRLFLLIMGWKIEGERPNVSKCVAIFAPHTSNWDFPLILSVVFGLGIKPNWIGKSGLFWGPMGFIFRWLGGIPVDRKKSTNPTNLHPHPQP